MTNETKRCPKCKKYKPYDDYARASYGLKGMQSYCKPCMVAYNRRMREKRKKLTKNSGWYFR